MISPMKWLAGLLLLLALAPRGAAAQEPPKFLIETIVVQGVQRAAGRQIVTDESLLKPGQTYSEQELRLAVYRIKRLPFVVDAEFSLRKGSERGAYELVVTVEEATPIFFSAEADAQRAQQTDFFTGKQRTTTVWQKFGTIGGREFVGSHGLAYGSVQKAQHQDGEFLRAGYTQYDLFGAGSFASAEIDSTEGVKGVDQLQAALFGGVPLTAAQSLRATLSWGRAKTSFGNDAVINDVSRYVDLAWVYNTTDDPLFPMSGSLADAFVTYRTDAEHDVDPQFDFDRRRTARDLRFGVSAEHFWPLTARQAVELGGVIAQERFSASTDPTARSFQATLTAGHSISLWGYEKTQRFGDLRFENTIVAFYQDDSSPFALSRVSKAANFVSSLAYRSRWGVLRASFTYVGFWRDL
jgi:hemolysin activation/secretion protein